MSIDLNKFKQIDDTFGHDVGDKILIGVANKLISTATTNEIFYRRSGDEFIILIFEKHPNYALKLVEKVESEIEKVGQEVGIDFLCSAAFGLLELKFSDVPFFEPPFLIVSADTLVTTFCG